MADYVISAVLQDGISAAANAASAAMNKAADSADNLTASVSKVGASANSLVNRYDPATKATTAYQKATDDLAKAQQTLAIAVAEGRVTEEQRATVLTNLTTKVAATRDAMANTIPVSNSLSSAHDVAARAATGAGHAHAGFTRELVIMGHEVITGNYSRVPGSMLVLAERTGNLNGIISTLGRLVFGWPGLFAAGAAALGALAYSAESSEKQFLGLETRLKATRTDFASMAAEAQNAAKAIAGSTSISSPDATAAAQTIAGSPNFTGTQSKLEGLIKTAGDLAVVMGQTVPDAAKTLAEGLNDPAKLAEQLAQESFPGMTHAMAQTIQRLQDTGDQAGATAKEIDVLRAVVDGAREKSFTPLQQVIADIAAGFRDIGTAAGDAAGKAAGFLTSQANEAATVQAQLKAQGGADVPGGGIANSIFSYLFPPLAGAQPGAAGTPGSAAFVNAFGAHPAARAPSQPAAPVVLPDLSITAQGPTGGANNNAAAINRAFGAALSVFNSSSAGQIQKYTDQITQFKAALADLGPRTSANAQQFDTLTGAIAADGKAIEDATKKTQTHVDAQAKQTETLVAETKAQNDLSVAYGQGAAAVDAITAKQAAEKSLISDGLIPGTQKYNDVLAQRTQLQIQYTEALGNADAAKQVADANRSAAAQEGVNAAYDGTTQSVTHAQDAAKAYAALLSDHLAPGTAEFSDKLDSLTQSYDRGSAASAAFQQEQSSVNELTNTLSNAFDQLGQGIVNAFLSGSGSAVNFGNVVKSVVGSIISQVAKLAIINPIVNSITGQNNGTLGSALSVLGGSSGGSTAGGTSSGGGSLLGGISDIGTLNSAANALGFNLGDSLGITGENGLLSNIGLTGSNGLFSGAGSGIGSILNTSLISPTLSTGGILPGDVITSATSGLSVGGLLSGVGLGYSAGGLVGGFVQNALGKTGPAPQVGAGVGAAAGAAIGSIIPGLGTVLGGPIGGRFSGGAGFFRRSAVTPRTSASVWPQQQGIPA